MAHSSSIIDLIDLKSKIRHHPYAYRNEVMRQLNHWESMLVCSPIPICRPLAVVLIFSFHFPLQSLLRISQRANTTRTRSKQLQSLIDFLSSVVDRYPNEERCVVSFPADLMSLLEEHHETLSVPIKKCMIKNLVFLSLKGLVDTTKLLTLFFRLLSVHEKVLRFLIYSSIVKIIVGIHKKSKSDAVSRSIQNYLFSMLSDENELTVKKSLSIVVELYRRRIWRNAKTVNIIAALCVHHKSTQIIRLSLHFVLGHRLELQTHHQEEELKEMKKRKLRSQVKDLKYNVVRPLSLFHLSSFVSKCHAVIVKGFSTLGVWSV